MAIKNIAGNFLIRIHTDAGITGYGPPGGEHVYGGPEHALQP
jgi:hypothetical protein